MNGFSRDLRVPRLASFLRGRHHMSASFKEGSAKGGALSKFCRFFRRPNRQKLSIQQEVINDLEVPAMKNGRLISSGRPNRNPANSGAIAAPVVRATPVMPAVA